MLKPSLLLLLPLALTACAPRPRPPLFFRPAASEIGPLLDNYGEAVIPAHGTIVVQGDDLVYGTAQHGGRPGINGSDVRRARITITEGLRAVLKGVHVVNEGYPGDTVTLGAERWGDEPVGSLLVLSYGFGDAQAHTPVAAYEATLRKLVRHAHLLGAAVFVVPSPNVADPKLQAALAPYQAAARDAAVQEGAEVFEPAADYARVKATPSKGVAQTAQGYQAIAAGMIPYIRPVAVSAGASAAGAPQTGQAGSADRATVRVSPARAS